LACGTPVVVSKIAAFREIVGSAGIFVEPTSAKSIARGISKVLKMNRDSYNKIVQRGIKRANIFSWEKAARKTLAVIKNAV